MAETFNYDVFLSHSSKDKPVVRALAERLRSDGLKVWFDEWVIEPGDSIPHKIEQGLSESRVLVLAMSANAFGSDWVALERHSYLFRDPANKQRRFIPLRLDDSEIPAMLQQFAYVDWQGKKEANYQRLQYACRVNGKLTKEEVISENESRVFSGHSDAVDAIAVLDSNRVVSGSRDNTLRVWNLETRESRVFSGHSDAVDAIAVLDSNRVISGSRDNTLRVWNLETRESEVLEGHSGAVDAIAVLDSNRVVSGSRDNTLRVWNLETRESRVLKGHSGAVIELTVLDSNRVVSRSWDGTLRVWNLETRESRVFSGHSDAVDAIAVLDSNRVVSGSRDNTLRVWNLETRESRVFSGHSDAVDAIAVLDSNRVISGSRDNTLRVWNLETRESEVLEGHSGAVDAIAVLDSNRVVSGSRDNTLRVWNLETRESRVFSGHSDAVDAIAVLDSNRVISGSRDNTLRVWNLETRESHNKGSRSVHYSNAKVLLVGDTGVGKSGLWHRLTKDRFISTSSTDGAWATQWKLAGQTINGIEREIWLWDFAGQADYRLMHQLSFDETGLAVLVFDPQREDTFEVIAQWDHALERASKGEFAKLLVAARVDRGGLRISDRVLEIVRDERGFVGFLKTSAKTGEGCQELSETIIENIDWKSRTTTSPLHWKTLKDEIIKLKDEEVVLLTLSELKQRLELRLPNESFTLAELRTIVGLLAAPGIVWPLDFGEYILLQPERVNQYASALVRSVRSYADEIGCILEEDLLAGKLDYQQLERLPPEQERVVLLALNQMLQGRGLCLKERTEAGNLLVFPSYFRRERPVQREHPAPFVTYGFKGSLDEIYATLVVKLHHTVAFDKDELWKDAADFTTQSQQTVGLKLNRLREGRAEIIVYCDPAVAIETKVLFIRYIHEHLKRFDDSLTRTRHFVCLNPECQHPVNDYEAVRKRLAVGRTDIPCLICGERVLLDDLIEQKFASPEIRQQVRKEEKAVRTILDNESLERILVAHTMMEVARAGHIFREVQISDWGIDGEIEFKDKDGKASGERVFVQLKSGDSYLRDRKRDQKEIFTIKNKRHIEYWQQHQYPVMLVIRKNDEVRWMDVSQYLKDRAASGEKNLKQVEFTGEPFNEFTLERLAKRTLGDRR